MNVKALEYPIRRHVPALYECWCTLNVHVVDRSLLYHENYGFCKIILSFSIAVDVVQRKKGMGGVGGLEDPFRIGVVLTSCVALSHAQDGLALASSASLHRSQQLCLQL